MKKKDTGADDAQDFSGMPAPASVGPADIQQKEFRVSRFGGYRMRDVDEFLDQVTEAMTKLSEENQRLRSATGLPVAPVPLPMGAPDLEDTARQADEIIQRARAEAAVILQDAREQAAGSAASLATDEGRAAVAAFLSQEKDFLQQLASLVQGHAESVKGMARASRSAAKPGASAPEPAAPPDAVAAAARRAPAATPALRTPGAAAGQRGRRSPPKRARRWRTRVRRSRSASKSRPRPRSRQARAMTRARRARAIGRCASCSGARNERGRPPHGGRPPLRPHSRSSCSPRCSSASACSRDGDHARSALVALVASVRRAVPPRDRRDQELAAGAIRRVMVTGSPSTSTVLSERRIRHLAVGELDRERLRGDLSAVGGERARDLAGRRDPQRDAIAHVQPRGLPGVLRDPHQLACEPFGPQLVGEFEVERDGEPPSDATPTLPGPPA